MGDVVNLRHARKAAARDRKEREAAANRIAHGTPKAVRKTADAQRRIDDRRLDGHRRDGSEPT